MRENQRSKISFLNPVLLSINQSLRQPFISPSIRWLLLKKINIILK